MTTYQCTVVKETRMRSTPSISAPQSFELLEPGTTFTASAVKVVKPGLEVWLQRDDGKWTAATYPNSAVPPVGKTFVTYAEKTPVTPPPTPVVVDVKIVRVTVDYIPVVDGVDQAPKTQVIEV